MFLKNLHLINFKNCPEAGFELSPGVNCFLGNNGEGKTNILDSIYYLSFCKSFFNSADIQNIRHGESFFVIQALFDMNGEEMEIYCGQKKGQKKSFKKNKKEYSRLSDHIGTLPLVMISPADTELITEGSDIRRKFLDAIISQYDKPYLEELIAYNKALLQRNALLKRFAETGSYSHDLLEIWDYRLIESGNYIHKKRTAFLDDFINLFSTYFAEISGGKEQVGIAYKSDLLEQDFASVLQQSLARDRASQFTQAGIHKDDLVFTINDFPVKKYGSQGQQKSYLIALKLAQYYYLARLKKVAPILLLDDIFDKLDDNRVGHLMKLVTQPDFGQVFITDTNAGKLPALLTELGVDFKVMHISEGVPV